MSKTHATILAALFQVNPVHKLAYTSSSGGNRGQTARFRPRQPRRNSAYNDLIPVFWSIATHGPIAH